MVRTNVQKKQGVKHVPVMLSEVLQTLRTHIEGLITKKVLDPKQEYTILDLTLGDAGHSLAIKQLLEQEFKSYNFDLYSFDWDKASIEFVARAYESDVSSILRCEIGCDNLNKQVNKNTDKSSNVNWALVHSNFAWISEFAKKILLKNIVFGLADLGISTRQIYNKTRGFSFLESKNTADMRMSKDFMQVKAFDLLNGLSQKELRDLFVVNIGLSKHIATMIAKEIIKSRYEKPFGFEDDVYRLNKIANILKKQGIHKFGSYKLHPATLIFLGLRMAVNSERQNLFQMLEGLGKLSNSLTALAIIGFHSVEWDLLESIPKIYKFNLKNILTPTLDEIRVNSKARSAKLFIYKHE